MKNKTKQNNFTNKNTYEKQNKTIIQIVNQMKSINYFENRRTKLQKKTLRSSVWKIKPFEHGMI